MTPFDWRDYIRVARSLASGKADEASLRAAVSRAYYAAYHVARERAPAKGVSFGPIASLTSHEDCWTAYKTVPALLKIGVTGDRLKKSRHTADYRTDRLLNWRSEADSVVQLASDLIAELDR